MTRLVLRGLGAHKLRSTLTSIAIILGVAMMSGTFVVSDQITNAFSTIFQTAFKGTDVFLEHRQVFTPQNGGGDQGPLPASLIARVRAVPGVADAEGQIQSLGALVVNGHYVSSVGGAPNIVFSVLPKPFNQNVLTSGRFPSAHGEIAVDTKLAGDHHLHIGQTLGLATPAGLEPVRVVGVFNFANSASLGGATISTITFADAQAWFDRAGRASVIVVSADHGVSPVDLKRRIIQAVPHYVETLTGTEAAREATQNTAGSINSFLTPALLAFAGAAVFVGAFIIFNTFSITVAQRMREFALLRTIGATRRQVMRAVLGEALVVGVVASVIGLLAGVGFAKLLNWLFGQVGFGLPLAGISIAPRTVIVPLGVGVSITVLAALVPALRATRVPPIAALREGATLPPSRFTRFIPYLAALMLLGGLAAVVQGFSSNGAASTKLIKLALGAVLVFLGTAMASRYLIRPLAGVLGWPLQRFARAPGTLARENATRNPTRTATTASALMIGIGLVVFVAVFANGFKETFLGALHRSVNADLIITSRSQGQVLPVDATAAAASSPSVSVASGISAAEVKIGNGGTDTANGIDPATLTRVYRFQWQRGGSDALLPQLANDGAVVEEQFAKSHNLSPGDSFRVTSATGARLTLHVLGQYKDPVLFGGFVVDGATSSRLATDPGLQVLLVRYAPGVTPTVGQPAVTRAMHAYPDAKVQTTAAYEQSVSDQINQLLYLLYVLLAMSVVISLFGIVNTLALSVFERTREIGMLRAIGTSRRQVRRMIRYESVITAIIGGVLGIVLGVVLAWIVTQGLKDQGIVFAVPWGQVIVSLVVAALAGVVAAALPARRASRLDVLEALQYE